MLLPLHVVGPMLVEGPSHTCAQGYGTVTLMWAASHGDWA